MYVLLYFFFVFQSQKKKSNQILNTRMFFSPSEWLFKFKNKIPVWLKGDMEAYQVPGRAAEVFKKNKNKKNTQKSKLFSSLQSH